MGYNKTYNILIVNSSAVYQITKGPAASGDIIQTPVRIAGEEGRCMPANLSRYKSCFSRVTAQTNLPVQPHEDGAR